MAYRQIFAGILVALLAVMCAIGAACEVSCAFAAMNSECHSDRSAALESASGSMSMDGSSMAGMIMPDDANADAHPNFSPDSQGPAAHPSIGEMGPCEKQGCETGSAISAKAASSGIPHFQVRAAPAESPAAFQLSASFHDARDSITRHHFHDTSPLLSSLRI